MAFVRRVIGSAFVSRFVVIIVNPLNHDDDVGLWFKGSGCDDLQA